jgi:hypothetical protein
MTRSGEWLLPRLVSYIQSISAIDNKRNDRKSVAIVLLSLAERVIKHVGNLLYKPMKALR